MVAMTKAARGEVKAKIVELLARSPGGKSGREVAMAIGCDRGRALTRLAELQDQGKVLGVVPKVASGKAIKVWFHPKFAAEAEKVGPRGWSKKATTVATALAPKRRDGGVMVTTAEPFVDRRWEPDGAVPRVIDSSQCRPWAAAATGVV
jgi:hypothetical protein